MGGTHELAIIAHAGDHKSATSEVIDDLIDGGTQKDIMSVNAATPYWAACTAVFKLNHLRGITRDRFNLVPTTMLVHRGRMVHFAGYLPSDWQVMQRCYYAVNAEAWFSNWPNEYEPDD